ETWNAQPVVCPTIHHKLLSSCYNSIYLPKGTPLGRSGITTTKYLTATVRKRRGRQKYRPHQYRRRDAPIVPRLRHERDRGPCGTPRRALRALRPRCWKTSTKKRSTSSRTTTRANRNPKFCLRVCRTCW